MRNWPSSPNVWPNFGNTSTTLVSTPLTHPTTAPSIPIHPMGSEQQQIAFCYTLQRAEPNRHGCRTNLELGLFSRRFGCCRGCWMNIRTVGLCWPCWVLRPRIARGLECPAFKTFMFMVLCWLWNLIPWFPKRSKHLWGKWYEYLGMREREREKNSGEEELPSKILNSFTIPSSY